MLKALLGATALALTAIASPAHGADMRYPAQPYAAPPVALYNWTGAYVGLNAGYQWGDVRNLPVSPDGFMGGAQAGYNWQFNQWVVGGEIDFQGSTADDRFAGWQFSNPWFGTVRGRAGYAMNNILFYGTAGFAYGKGKLELGPLSETHVHTGWTAGGGIEVGLMPNWTVKAEYLHVDLGNQRYALSGLSHDITSNILRFGVNYRF